MPLYEYICEDCGTRFDAFRSINEADRPISCKKCFSQHTHRALSLFFAASEGKPVAGTTSGGCSSCSGGSCSCCGS
ncbi:MAG: zinc ribbon domain-containing protein [Chloroflexota bacterium]